MPADFDIGSTSPTKQGGRQAVNYNVSPQKATGRRVSYNIRASSRDVSRPSQPLTGSFINRRASSGGGIGGVGSHPNQQRSPSPSLSWWRRILTCYGCFERNVEQRTINTVATILNSRSWYIAMIITTFLLLFGGQIRDIFLWPVHHSQTAFDVLFLLCFLFFATDIILRIVAETNYFDFFGLCASNKKGRQQSRGNDSNTSNCNWGSFLFWCDLFSTLAILSEISWLNPEYFAERHYEIIVGAWGLPNPKDSRPLEFGNEIPLFITIAKTARMARFIRSSSVVKLSSNVNWFFFCDLLNPKRLFQFLFCKCVKYGPIQATKRAYTGKISLTKTTATAKGPMEESSVDPNNTSGEFSARPITSPTVAGTNNNARVTSDGEVSDTKTHKKNESQVGTAMRELTTQRIAFSILTALLLTSLFTYTELDATYAATMVVLHNQTGTPAFINLALTAATKTTVPNMFSFELRNGTVINFDGIDPGPDRLPPRQIMQIEVVDDSYVPSLEGNTTTSRFSIRKYRVQESIFLLVATFFIIFIWVVGVMAFAGPVMVLVVVPIERMVRLLGMLMLDPLGYQSTVKYKRFVNEEDELTKNSRWTKEVLKGMETSFLMSTILRIGNLMKVGYGSAGVEIIRQNLEKSQSKNMSLLNSQGSIVSCIFLFCDIRNFTDATESLQEEVFVFTNNIAAVVHSNCSAYGGSANKNVGDAFLCSWLLDQNEDGNDDDDDDRSDGEDFTAKNNQADKCLLAVVRICMALRHDEYYLEALSPSARDALITKLQNRTGSVVQMGFGLHAGKAVQGAIGSQRKIDATYVSEAVERSEFLESSTKKYGLKMLMSDSFHRLLDKNSKRRCRKIDQILVRDEDNEDDDDVDGEILNIFTFDMDIEALTKADESGPKTDTGRGSESDLNSEAEYRAGGSRGVMKSRRAGRVSVNRLLTTHKERWGENTNDEMSEKSGGGLGLHNLSGHDSVDGDTNVKKTKLVLPNGPALYNASVWISEEMRIIRQRYSDGFFFPKFNAGLQSFYSKDWDHAKQCFASILARFEDGPSRYFLTQIENHGGKPPRDFLGYGTT